MRFVLRQYQHPSQSGINAIGEGKIDGTKLTAKRNCGFGVPTCERVQATAAAARQDKNKDIALDHPN